MSVHFREDAAWMTTRPRHCVFSSIDKISFPQLLSIIVVLSFSFMIEVPCSHLCPRDVFLRSSASASLICFAKMSSLGETSLHASSLASWVPNSVRPTNTPFLLDFVVVCNSSGQWVLSHTLTLGPCMSCKANSANSTLHVPLALSNIDVRDFRCLW